MKKPEKPIEIKEQHYTNSWVMIMSLTLFFISFFTSYFVSANEITSAFIKSVVVMLISHAILYCLVKLWEFSIPKAEWMLIVHGPPMVDSRSQRATKQRIKQDLLDRRNITKAEETFTFSETPEE